MECIHIVRWGRWGPRRSPFINSWANIKLHLCSPAKQPISNQPSNHSGIQATDCTQPKRPNNHTGHNRKSQSSACGPYQGRIHIFRAHIFTGFWPERECMLSVCVNVCVCGWVCLGECMFCSAPDSLNRINCFSTKGICVKIRPKKKAKEKTRRVRYNKKWIFSRSWRNPDTLKKMKFRY